MVPSRTLALKFITKVSELVINFIYSLISYWKSCKNVKLNLI